MRASWRLLRACFLLLPLLAACAGQPGPLPSAQGGATIVSLEPSQRPAGTSTIGAVGQPMPDATVRGLLQLSGWALAPTSQTPPGENGITIYVDGAPVVNGSYGRPRPDIARAYGSAFQGSGWTAVLDVPATMAPGPHTIQAGVAETASGTQSVFTSTVQAAPSLEFGISSPLLRVDSTQAVTDLDRIKTSHLGVVRLDLDWDQLEPGPGQWNAAYLTRLDRVMAAAQDRALRPIVVFLRTPAWARHGAGSVMTPPDNPAEYAAVAAFIAGRYANQPGFALEVWNEPNDQHFWDAPNGPDASVYAALLQATYPAVKQAAPNVRVLAGSLAFNDPGYVQGMYAAGAGDSFDALSVHPYSLAASPDDRRDPSHSFTDALQDLPLALAQAGQSGKPIWITEMGWSTNMVTDATRAAYMARAIQLARSQPSIQVFCAYTLDQSADLPDYGLITPQGQPTASWTAYVRAAAGQ